jgi:flagellar biosynthesis/type III secretory pathway protein FliH
MAGKQRTGEFMSTPVFFEDFSGGQNAPQRGSSQTSDPLEGYELGYKAGWDDAVKAHQESQTHLSTVLAQNLEQIEFSLVEAQTDILKSMKPVFNEITSTLLPGLSDSALRALIAEEIANLLKEHVPNSISIIVSEQDEAPVAALLNSTRELSEVSLISKASLSDGQAYISCADQNRKIDVGEAIGDIQIKIQDFLKQPELEQANVG